MSVDGAALPDGADEPVVVDEPIRVARRGVETKLVIDGAPNANRGPDPALVKAVARTHVWLDDLTSGHATSIRDIAEREGVTDRFVSLTLNLAFLSPAVVEAIMDGRQAAELTTKGLTFGEEPALLWSEQTAQLLQLVSP